MACVALTSLMATIELEFLKLNHRVCVDDEKPLKSLFQKLSSLEAFLKKEYNNGGAPNRDVEIKIRDFALRAEDVIEIQLRNILLPNHKEHQHTAHGELHQTLRQLEKEAKELLNIINNTMDNDTLPLIRWSEPDNILSGGSLQCSPKLHDILMIGRLYLFNRARDALIDERYPQRRVISIFGVPDERLLCSLLQSMRPTLVNEIDMGTTVSQLKRQLYNHLKCKRYFIVLDDVSNPLLWDDIQQCFPDDSNGSRIFLTTRFRDCVIKTLYFLRFLTQDESWDLFCHRLSLKRSMEPEFEEIAKCLVEECQGLPRSIVMVAQRLSKCNYTLKEWKKVEKELLSLGTLYADTQHLSKLTDMYNQLPQHLKVCFLYLAVFPKGIDIQVERLARLWIAEGFVKPLRDVPLEDIAYKYLGYLDERGLVHYGFKTCSIHNDMHSFCVREAQKESLLCVVNTRQVIGWPLEVLANSCRWLSLRSHTLDYHVLFSSNIPSSLLFFHGDSEMFVPFKHLRILDFSESLVLKRVPLPLGDLVFLRYLSVPQWFEGLDDVVSTNLNLQTLIVSGIDQSTLGAPALHLSSKIWEPQQLRHLELGEMYTLDPPNVVKEHLQTLVCAMPIQFRKEVYYCRFPSIRKLEILYKDVLEPGCTHGSCGNRIIILENFEDLLRLESLTVIVPVGNITLLERLGFSRNLKKLKLSGTNFPVKVLRVIRELPVLEVLKLENAFYGRVWEVAEGGFFYLHELVLEAKNLEQWVASASSFQRLANLVLRCCYFLEEIPPIIAKSLSLRSIKLERCPPSVVTSAKWIQQQHTFHNSFFPPKITVDGEIL